MLFFWVLSHKTSQDEKQLLSLLLTGLSWHVSWNRIDTFRIAQLQIAITVLHQLNPFRACSQSTVHPWNIVAVYHAWCLFLVTGDCLNIRDEQECRRLHFSLRDLSTMERALGRLAEHFTGEVNFAYRFTDGEAIVER